MFFRVKRTSKPDYLSQCKCIRDGSSDTAYLYGLSDLKMDLSTLLSSSRYQSYYPRTQFLLLGELKAEAGDGV